MSVAADGSTSAILRRNHTHARARSRSLGSPRGRVRPRARARARCKSTCMKRKVRQHDLFNCELVKNKNPRHTRKRTISRCSCAYRSWLSISIHTVSQRRRPQKPQRFLRKNATPKRGNSIAHGIPPFRRRSVCSSCSPRAGHGGQVVVARRHGKAGYANYWHGADRCSMAGMGLHWSSYMCKLVGAFSVHRKPQAPAHSRFIQSWLLLVTGPYLL